MISSLYLNMVFVVASSGSVPYPSLLVSILAMIMYCVQLSLYLISGMFSWWCHLNLDLSNEKNDKM